jgi:triosephosphate isomerase
MIVGNWKMNGSRGLLSDTVAALLKIRTPVKVVLCVPYTLLQTLEESAQNSNIGIGSQNVHQEVTGAYTGEVSVEQLKECNVQYCLVGHSERRQYFQENNELISKKVKRLLQSAIHPILCIGETLEEREAGDEQTVVGNQLSEGLKDIAFDDLCRCIVAYEPVWAIGTGKTATPDQANEMHRFIRGQLISLSNVTTAAEIPILYGGSVKGSNAPELLAKSDIDGALVGGASLQLEDLKSIILSAQN